MEQQNHELLGLIVAQQRAICDALIAEEKKEEDRITRRQIAFADTCIPALWDSVQEIDVPHYFADRAGLTIPMRRYGYYIRNQDVIVGIKVRRRDGGEATWKCKLSKDGQIKYVGDGVFVGDVLQRNASLTKQQFEQAFIGHIARVIPVDKLMHIQPVGLTEKKGRRRVVAMAE